MHALIAALLITGIGAQLVGPGGVVPYGGGGGGPRRVGTVRDWAQGFFVAGSTLDDLNGVYALVDPNTLRRACRTRRCKVAYRNEESDWILAFAGPPVGLKTKSGKETEWVFIDQSGKDRFEHAGDTVIPGAGDSWSHSHRPSPYERTAAEDMAAGDDDDDVNELPWQVIYIGDRNMVWNLVNQRRHHNAVIRNALAGNAVSEFGSLQALAAPDGAAPEDKREPLEPPPDLVAKADASEAAQFASQGDYGKCADAWAAGKYAIQPFWNRAEDAEVVKWASALASLRRGECCRRSRRFDEARTSLSEALALFPTYGAALVADAALALDAGRASDALRNAERLAWTDRTRDGVRDAVVFAAVDVERRRLAGGNESHNHYLVLGVTRDFGTDELRKAFRTASRSAHPDKNDGSTAAFERVSAAHDCLGDPEKRLAYDRGDDLDRGFERDGTTQGMPFSERILRRYFPEDFKYEPFGDPFERKRDYEREKRRRAPARPNGATIPPGSYLGSCAGCDMEPGGVLLCQKCQTGYRGQVEEASINPSSCADDEHVGNRHGALICEKKPEVEAPRCLAAMSFSY